MVKQRGHNRTVNLEDGLLIENAQLVLAASDEWADAIGADIKLRGTAVDLTGATCKGYFVRADGVTVTLTGEVFDNHAGVELSEDCYLVDGPFTFALVLEQNDIVSTVRFIRGRVIATTSSLIGSGSAYSLEQLTALINAKLSAPAADGSNGYVLTTDGAGGVSWQDVTVGNVAGTVKVNNTAYTLRTGATGAAGYLTFVTEE